jgi:hypothetical protein
LRVFVMKNCNLQRVLKYKEVESVCDEELQFATRFEI